MRFNTLQEWLAWQERLHPNAIDLGLERVRRVLRNLGLARPAFPLLTVGGTNGKGSCVAYLESMLRAAGYRTGAYTSPHLLRYNERVRVDGEEATDGEFCESFERVDRARGDISLTYFEFGTLAALDIFTRRGVKVAVLEVGMGGRLDAVNAVDPEGALVASVSLDHQEWLGPDRESIGFEKAGIYRGGKPAVCGDRVPPAALLKQAADIHADLRLLGRDFDCTLEEDAWNWRGPEGALRSLPPPALPGRIQYDNAASAIALLKSVAMGLPVPEAAIREGLRSVRLTARFQRIPGEVETLLDVAHNPDAARVLAANLQSDPARGRTLGVMGMFKDKAVEEVAEALAPCLDRWYLAGLEGPRGQDAGQLAARVLSRVPRAALQEFPAVPAAYAAARREARLGDRIVVFGSFQTVGSVLKSW
ncbi:MAG: bifunctional tetrahydrofolate synthase/dihydrofolate synthase [Bacillota bacterium]